MNPAVIPDEGVDGCDGRSDVQLTLHLEDEVRSTHPTGNIFLTNIQRVYSGDDIPAPADDENTMDCFLGTKPRPGVSRGGHEAGNHEGPRGLPPTGVRGGRRWIAPRPEGSRIGA